MRSIYRKIVLPLAVAAVLGLDPRAASAAPIDHDYAQWTAMLQTYLTKDAMVRYAAWKPERTKLQDYLKKDFESVAKAEFCTWSADQRKAWLINAYNAYTIELVLSANLADVKSMKDDISEYGKISKPFLGNVWKIPFLNLLGGDIKSLHAIEHDVLRKGDLICQGSSQVDPRIHAAINCAAISCPRLRHEAYRAAHLDAQLDDGVKIWLNDPSRNDFSQTPVHVSQIFEFFPEDFGEKKGVCDFIVRYGPPVAQTKLKAKCDYKMLTYSWLLNKAP